MCRPKNAVACALLGAKPLAAFLVRGGEAPARLAELGELAPNRQGRRPLLEPMVAKGFECFGG